MLAAQKLEPISPQAGQVTTNVVVDTLEGVSLQFFRPGGTDFGAGRWQVEATLDDALPYSKVVEVSEAGFVSLPGRLRRFQIRCLSSCDPSVLPQVWMFGFSRS